MNEQTQQTYYNHPSRTLYERFVEAYYHFNKENVGRKEEIIRKANELWKESKGNEQYVNEYLQKQKEDKLKIRNSASCSLKSGFFKHCTTSSNDPSKQTTKEPSSAELCSEPSSSSAVAASSILFKPSTSNLKILGQFFNNIEPTLSRIIPKLENEELLLSVLEDATKAYNSIEKQLSCATNSGENRNKKLANYKSTSKNSSSA